LNGSGQEQDSGSINNFGKRGRPTGSSITAKEVNKSLRKNVVIEITDIYAKQVDMLKENKRISTGSVRTTDNFLVNLID
jgi:hypothetical protein